ncbi:hypothetical protein QFZ36_003945 [Pseudarthrobacter siccitolerans]|uniref:DUF5666 domain-containing protein n=1 Tax=Pseudarthrobacter siccitolerans TaxID=861266 RepID=A0ABU0PT00_9MICC|nr:DUF5666 domain-containing protein [Pseudarthrobacter siccitolerans]MDQ0676384.1 hypothetical protein [Pseudarthrobacter siccitolerans]
MFVPDPLKIRKTVLAGAVALALTGTGVAFAWAAGDTFPPSPSPSQSQSVQGQENGKDKPDKAQRPQHLHSESVVKKADGTFQTILEQRGTVETVSDTSITVKSEDGYSRTYTVNADTKIHKAPAAASQSSPGSESSEGTNDDGKRVKPGPGSIADIATGDTVRISGVKNGDQATAERIAEGGGDDPGLGLGRGHGQGHGKGHNNPK